MICAARRRVNCRLLADGIERINMLFPQVTYSVVIWGLYVGIVAAAIVTSLSRFTTGNAVRALIAEGATDKENAKTADELGLFGHSRRVLRGSMRGKLFIVANPDEAEIKPKRKRPEYKMPKLDMNIARFYLPKEKEGEALERFPLQSIPKLILALVIITGFFAALHFFLPPLVDMMISALPG